MNRPTPVKASEFVAEIERSHKLMASSILDAAEFASRKQAAITALRTRGHEGSADDFLFALIPMRKLGALADADVVGIKAALDVPRPDLTGAAAPSKAPSQEVVDPPSMPRVHAGEALRITARPSDLSGANYAVSKVLGLVPFGRLAAPDLQQPCPGCGTALRFKPRQGKVSCRGCGRDVKIDWELKGFDRIV